jgi:excinuclease ABC subunit B
MVFLYADTITDSMKKAMDETSRRRLLQMQYNREHGITPQTIQKEIREGLTAQIKARKTAREALSLDEREYDKIELAGQIEREMLEAAEALDFERAAFLRDQLKEIKELPQLVIASSHRKKRDFVATKKQKKRWHPES